ncbi:MAG: hypothetical protein HWN66_18780 [Candidatus Helarchaeota archaeon]|nr:hypothetical protein [Candidatus Helarchaeota archaeon]
MSNEKKKERKIDQEALKKNYETCGDYLNRMKLEDMEKDPKTNSYTIPLTFTFPDDFEIKLKTIFRVTDRFLMAKCLLLFYKDINRSIDIDLKMNTLLLRANFELFDVTYSLDDQNNVYVEMDIIPTANYEAFEDELKGLFFGIEYFFNKILSEVFEEIKRVDTYKRYVS